MAPSSEEKHSAESLIFYMHECVSIQLTWRKKIATSKELHNLLFSIADDGTSETSSLLKEALDRCSTAIARAAKGREDKKRHETFQTDMRPAKKIKASPGSLENPPKLLVNSAVIPDMHTSQDSAMKDASPLCPTPPLITKQLESAVRPMPQQQTEAAVSSQSETRPVNALASPQTDGMTAASPPTNENSDRESNFLSEIQESLPHEEDRMSSAEADQPNNESLGQGQTDTERTTVSLAADQQADAAPGSAHDKSPPISMSPPNASDSILVSSNGTEQSQQSPRDSEDAANSNDDIDRDHAIPDASSTIVHSAVRTAFEIEVAITRGDPSVLKPIRAHFLKQSPFRNQESHIDSVLDTCRKFDFAQIKRALLYFFEGRRANASSNMSIPSTWDMHDTTEIISAIEIIGNNSDHAKIHRAFAQMRLYTIVQQQLSSALVTRGRGRHIALHLVILDGMAAAQSTGTSEQEKLRTKKTYKDLEAAYRAGKHWLQVADWFGGVGILFVFVLRGEIAWTLAAVPRQQTNRVQ